MRITAGKEVPDSDRERVQIGLRRFEELPAKALLDLLLMGLEKGKTGSISLQVWITAGALVKHSARCEWSGDIDSTG